MDSTTTREAGGGTAASSMLGSWRWRAKNLQPSLRYRRSHQPVPEEAARVVDALNRDGAAVTSVDALVGQDGLWEELKRYADRAAEAHAAELEEARRTADVETPGKSYIFKLVRGPVTLTPENDILARFAVQPAILGIANAYVGMYTRLRNVDIWHTLKSSLPARDSQLWHRDPPDDRHLVKFFVYLTDVDEGSGPFIYAGGTHPKGDVHGMAAATKMKKAWRTTDEQMAEIAPPERWINGVGPAGTIVIADTRGYHKGGECRDRDRILYHLLFSSAGHRKPGSKLAQPVNVSGELSAEQRFALGA